MWARTVEIGVNDRSHHVTVERTTSSSGHLFRVSWDGTTRVVDFCQVNQALSLVILEGGSASYQVRCVPGAHQSEFEVHVGGAVVRTLVNTGQGRFGEGTAHDDLADGEQEVTAPMPGKVVRVLVRPGDEVGARQGVIVIEAMKMENELRAPKAGLVTAVSAEEGMSVEAGRVLVVIT